MSKKSRAAPRTCPECGGLIRNPKLIFCPHCKTNIFKSAREEKPGSRSRHRGELEPRLEPSRPARKCPACGATISKLSRVFCPHCDVNMYEYASKHETGLDILGETSDTSESRAGTTQGKKPRLQKLRDKVQQKLGLETDGPAAAPLPGLEEQRRKANRTVNKYLAVAGGTAVVTGPIPGTSLALTGVEAKMVYDIARVYGFQLEMKEAATIISLLLSTSLTLKAIATEASTAVPVVGWWVAKPAIACGVCKAVGAAAIRYFEDKVGDQVEHGSPQGQLAVLDRSMDMDAQPQDIFGYVSTLTNMPRIWPSLLEIRELEQLPSGAKGCHWTYDLAGIRLEGIGEILDSVPDQRLTAATRGGIEGTTAWVLDTKGPRTQVAFKAEYTVPSAVLAKTGRELAVRQNEHEIDLALTKLKIALES